MPLIHSPLVHDIIGAALAVHRELGPGLFEAVYQGCFGYELTKRNLAFVSQVPLPVTYDGQLFSSAYRADVLVAGDVVVELKSVERLLPLHSAQTLTYLRLSGARHGLLINFNGQLLKHGIRSFIAGQAVPVMVQDL